MKIKHKSKSSSWYRYSPNWFDDWAVLLTQYQCRTHTTGIEHIFGSKSFDAWGVRKVLQKLQRKPQKIPPVSARNECTLMPSFPRGHAKLRSLCVPVFEAEAYQQESKSTKGNVGYLVSSSLLCIGRIFTCWELRVKGMFFLLKDCNTNWNVS